jgi:hypothetical protein
MSSGFIYIEPTNRSRTVIFPTIYSIVFLEERFKKVNTSSKDRKKLNFWKFRLSCTKKEQRFRDVWKFSSSVHLCTWRNITSLKYPLATAGGVHADANFFYVRFSEEAKLCQSWSPYTFSDWLERILEFRWIFCSGGVRMAKEYSTT